MVSPIKGFLEVKIKTEEQADSIVDALDEQERKKLLDALNKKMGIKKKKENKEAIEEIPELADKNFRVENTQGRKEVRDDNGLRVLENKEKDVREYLEGNNKGEQLFTQDSALRETKKAGKRLPDSGTTYRDIINKKYAGNYQDFLKGENIVFPGWRHPNHKGFYRIDKDFDLRCADGSSFNGNRNEWDSYKGNSSFGFSVRCLKD